MYALLEFMDYTIEQRTKFSKPKVLIKKTGSVVELSEIKNKIDGYAKVEKFLSGNLEKDLYSCNREIVKATIPPTTKLGTSLFKMCRNLKTVTLPDSITSIGDYAFCGCSNLTAITLPDSITHIDKYAFYHCYSLTSIDIPDDIVTIEEGTFACCAKLTSIRIPNNVTSIGSDAFKECRSLTSIIYKGQVYTNKSELINVLEKNEVDIEKNIFSGTALNNNCIFFIR